MSKAEIYHSSMLDELTESITPSESYKTRKRMLLATRIDDAIQAKGWKKKEFALALGKKPSEITKWLSGTHNFTIDTLFDIEELLGIELVSVIDSPKEQVIRFHLEVSTKSGAAVQWTRETDMGRGSQIRIKRSTKIESGNVEWG